MGRRLIRLVALTPLAFALIAGQAIRAETNIMLVFGNQEYAMWDRLATPVNDADEVKKLLTTFRFDPLPGSPEAFRNKGEFTDAIAALQSFSKSQRIDDLVVYYAGHGVDMAPGGPALPRAYLVPTGAAKPPVTTELVDIENDLIGALASVDARHIFVILDACGSGLAVRGLAHAAEKKKRDFTKPGRILITSATDGRAAYDVEGGVSPFTNTLVAGLRDKKCDLNSEGLCTSADIAAYLQIEMVNKTGGLQIPSFGRFPGDEDGEIAFPLDTEDAKDWLAADKGDPQVLRKFLDMHRSGPYGGKAQSTLFALESDLLRKSKLEAANLADFPDASSLDLPGGVRIHNLSDDLYYVWIPLSGAKAGATQGGFWMGETEVTVGAFRRFRGNGVHSITMPSPAFNRGWKDDSQPIVNVSWQEAKDYCVHAGGTLPTGAQWEYAARGDSNLNPAEPWTGAASKYEKTALRPDQPRANVADAWQNKRAPFPQLARVPSFRPSPLPAGSLGAWDFGLYDMIGNVAEWTLDEVGDKRDVRGGSFAHTWSEANLLHPWHAEQIGDNRIGFRCVIHPRSIALPASAASPGKAGAN